MPAGQLVANNLGSRLKQEPRLEVGKVQEGMVSSYGASGGSWVTTGLGVVPRDLTG